MVQFNELYITPDSKRLVIEAQVKDLNYYNNVYISEVIIDNQDTYKDNGPSNSYVYKHTVSGNSKSVRLELDSTDLTINNKMLFVYIVTGGAPTIDTPCGMDNTITIGVVINRYIIYKYIMSNIKDIGNTCKPSKSFIDAILRLKALDLSIETGHYTEAINFYNKFFLSKKLNVTTNSCGCNG